MPDTRRFAPGLGAVFVAAIVLLAPRASDGELVAVRHAAGLLHGFLALTTRDGAHLADGDLMQTASGTRVTSRLVFRFEDGSRYDETTVFSERDEFRLVSDRLVESGPSFPTPLEMSIDAASGRVTVRYTDGHGEEKVEAERLDLPADLANGLIPTLLENVPPDAPPKGFGFVVATPKPRLVKLKLERGGKVSFSTGAAARRATRWVLKVDIGGLTGLLASLAGKTPPDSHVWILGGEAPAFVRAEQPLYVGGPVWRIELVSPVWHTSVPPPSEARPRARRRESPGRAPSPPRSGGG